MKSFRCCLLSGFLGISLASAAVINDGTTTAGLVRLANDVTPGATTTLSVVDQTNLLASAEQPAFTLPFIHTVWYDEAIIATGTTYTVSADFRPAAAANPLRGGTAAWLDPQTGVGISFSLLQGATAYAEVESFNFSAGTSVSGALFDTNGMPVDSFSSAWRTALNAGYRSTNFLTLELAFAEPSTNDLAVLSNATARITGRALQNNGSGPQPVGGTVSLLTTLPRPGSGEQRFGYYAVYRLVEFSSVSAPIGRLDNLTVNGEFGIGNRRPTVTLTQPLADATFYTNEVVHIVADATDPDPGDTVVRVDFYVDDALLGSDNTAPFELDWMPDAAGAYVLTAVAEDSHGATSQPSAPVAVSVQVRVPTTPPVMTVDFVDGWVVVGWDQLGFTLQGTYDLGANATWDNLVSTGLEYREPADQAHRFYRLVGEGQLAPALALEILGGQALLTWDQDGYELQATENLGDPQAWQTLQNGGTSYAEPVDQVRRFYRLFR